jgi:hypothetical protein
MRRHATGLWLDQYAGRIAPLLALGGAAFVNYLQFYVVPRRIDLESLE